MVNIQVLIKVSGADVPEAVEVISVIGNQIKGSLGAHSLTIKVRVYCERCGEPMELQGKTLICNTCLADEAVEAQLERRMGPDRDQFHAPMPDEPLEVAIY